MLCFLLAYFIGARRVVMQNTPYSERNSNTIIGGFPGQELYGGVVLCMKRKPLLRQQLEQMPTTLAEKLDVILAELDAALTAGRVLMTAAVVGV